MIFDGVVEHFLSFFDATDHGSEDVAVAHVDQGGNGKGWCFRLGG